jgi:hypothetical protein
VPSPETPSFAFQSAEGTGDEGASAYLVIVRSNNISVPCDVTFTVAGGTAVNGVDYVLSPAPGTIHFEAGNTMAVVKVKIFEDMVTEGWSTAVFSLAGANGAVTGSPSTFTLRIRDTTDLPVITFYEPGAYANGTHELAVVVQRVGPKNASADILLTIEDGPAVYGRDFYCSPAPGRIQFAPGESVKTVIVTVSDDAAAGDGICAWFKLSDPHGASVGNMSTFTLYMGAPDSGLLPDSLTTVLVKVPVTEILPGAIFGFPAAIVAVITGFMMVKIGGRRRRDQ